MKRTKLDVLQEVAPTDAITPEDAIARAREFPSPADRHDGRRIFVRDYLPAMRELIGKGYSISGAARVLISFGCPFTFNTLCQTYKEKR